MFDIQIQCLAHSKPTAGNGGGSGGGDTADRESVHSVEGSITDSGRGPSEEGEGAHVKHCRYLPPPPPPPRGAYWLQPSMRPTHGSSHPTVRFKGLSTMPEEGIETVDVHASSDRLSSVTSPRPLQDKPYVCPQPNTCSGVNSSPWVTNNIRSTSDSRATNHYSSTRQPPSERFVKCSAEEQTLLRKSTNGGAVSPRNHSKPVILGPNVIV